MRFFQQDVNDSAPDGQLEFRLLQPIWDLRIGRERWVSSPIFPPLFSIASYFTMCTLLCLLELHGKNWDWMKQFKIQDNREVKWPMVARAIRHTALNNFILFLPTTIAQYLWVPNYPLPRQAPTVFEYVGQVVAMLLIFDFQYWVWHASHHKNRWLYRTFHSIHHQYHSTFSWTTQYLHPWEVLTVGFFATVDPWFFNCHPMTYWTFLWVNIAMSIEAHCGLDFPLAPHKWIPFHFYGGGPKHDMHHMRPLTNFQPFFSSWDRLMGWDCPGLNAKRTKSARLLAWEEKNRDKRLNKSAFQLMGGTVNGWLVPEKDRNIDPAGVTNEPEESKQVANGTSNGAANGTSNGFSNEHAERHVKSQ